MSTTPYLLFTEQDNTRVKAAASARPRLDFFEPQANGPGQSRWIALSPRQEHYAEKRHDNARGPERFFCRDMRVLPPAARLWRLAERLFCRDLTRGRADNGLF